MKPLPSIGVSWQLLKSAAQAWLDDYAPSMGAALAYYTVFSLAPLLLIVIALRAWCSVRTRRAGRYSGSCAT